MEKIAWVTDTTSSLTPEFIHEHNIHVVPLNLLIDGISYKETIDLSNEEFYNKLKTSKESPKSSQPALGDLVELYTKLKDNYDRAIVIHCSSKLSGTYQSSISAAEMIGFKVDVIDSKIGSYPIKKMIEAGVSLLKEKVSIDEIIRKINQMVELSKLYFVPFSLEQLHKSGRVSGTQLFIGNLIKLNLLLGFDNGSVVVVDKVRTFKKMRTKLDKLLHDAIERNLVDEVCILHANNKAVAQEWMVEFKERYPFIRFVVNEFIPVVSIHAGEGTLGLSWINKK